jgi:hypothetical protein
MAVISCHDYPLTSSAPNSGVDNYRIIYPKSGQNHRWKQAHPVLWGLGFSEI